MRQPKYSENIDISAKMADFMEILCHHISLVCVMSKVAYTWYIDDSSLIYHDISIIAHADLRFVKEILSYN